MTKVLFGKRTCRTPGIPLMLMLGIVLLSTIAYSQDTASILGTVTDQTGGAVPNAKIAITNTDTGIVHSTTTNATGSYSAHELPFGHYAVKVEGPGFKNYARTGI